MKGKIKWFNIEKGFGFIVGEDDKDYFVHVTQMPEGIEIIEDMDVDFETTKTTKGTQAMNVKLNEGGDF